MNSKLFRYSDFLNESKIEMLLEANITYGVLFSKMLDQIDSPVATALSNLSGTEVDVNTNFVDVNRDKDDVVFFKPDDKVSKAAMTPHPGAAYDMLSKNVLGDEYRIPATNQIGEIVKEYTKEEVMAISSGNFDFMYDNGGKLVLFMWRDSKGVGKCFYDVRSITFGPEAVKQSEVSVGRFVRAILKKANVDFKDSEIEDFVYKYRAEVAKLGDVFSRFKLLEGKDIRKYYHHDKYENDKGTLGSSCMRYNRCQEYFDIYVKNTEECNLVVLMSDEKDDSICGRAILWTDHEGRRLMDRIYTNRTQDEQLFKDFAKKNKFYHKKNQNMLEDEYFVSPEGEEEELMTKIELSAGGYDYFPYLDTFKYFYEGRPSYVTNNSKLPYDYTLTDTDGGAEGLECGMCNGNSILECPECDGRGNFKCEMCNGEGEVECDTCGGAHEMECPECDGEGTSEDGSECTYCEGRGMKTCDECDGDSITCTYCDDGDGRIECDLCRGGGEVDCPECH